MTNTTKTATAPESVKVSLSSSSYGYATVRVVATWKTGESNRQIAWVYSMIAAAYLAGAVAQSPEFDGLMDMGHGATMATIIFGTIDGTLAEARTILAALRPVLT